MNNFGERVSMLIGGGAEEVHNLVWSDEKVVVFINERENDIVQIHNYMEAGFTVRIWDENNWSSFEAIEESFRQLRKDLKLPDAEYELELYKEKRHQLCRELFGVD